MFAAHHRLSSLIALVDMNGRQALGRTTEILNLEPMAPRWQAFGWDVREVDGHDPVALADAVSSFDTTTGPPHLLLARTVFGKGVSFMEGRIKWHYWPMSPEEYRQALAELEVSG